MSALALVTADASLANDYDMPLILDACRTRGVNVEVCAWHDPAVIWQDFNAVVLRSPWDYSSRLPVFLDWCEQITSVTNLLNPLPVIRWSLDKHYLKDLERQGVPIIPTKFVEPGEPIDVLVRSFLQAHESCDDFVAKPAIGCYSKDVRRFHRSESASAMAHMQTVLADGNAVLIQPYLPSVDTAGETNLIYFNGTYSHAIRKAALLANDGTVNVPTNNFRAARDAAEDEQAVAVAALEATSRHLGLSHPLLYARIDLVRDGAGQPRVLELEIAEPSLSLPFVEEGANRFAAALATLAAPN